MIYIETGSTDVYYNFGLENYFTVEKRLPDTVFLFWRTTPTLMVGKYQNVLEEINKPYADAHGIHLVRRMSGGTGRDGSHRLLQRPQRSDHRRSEVFRQRPVPAGRLHRAPRLPAV